MRPHNLTQFTYWWSREKPEQSARAILPTQVIPVEYPLGTVLSTVEIRQSEYIVLSLPEDLVAKIEMGKAIINPYGQLTTNEPDVGVRYEQIFAIIIQDKD